MKNLEPFLFFSLVSTLILNNIENFYRFNSKTWVCPVKLDTDNLWKSMPTDSENFSLQQVRKCIFSANNPRYLLTEKWLWKTAASKWHREKWSRQLFWSFRNLSLLRFPRRFHWTNRLKDCCKRLEKVGSDSIGFVDNFEEKMKMCKSQ